MDKRILKNKSRIGESNTNVQGLKMTIIEYRGSSDINVLFEDGTIVKTRYGNFVDGTILNHNHPSVLGKGYLGYGDFKSHGKDRKCYKVWHSMLTRCYDKKFHEREPTYIDCEVCEEWLNFQNFAKWYYANIWDENCLVLDKDILYKNNKIYCPERCVLVDKRINSLFISSKSYSSKYGKGITKRGNSYIVRISKLDIREQVYRGKDLEEARKRYREEKSKYVKEVAEFYKTHYENFPIAVYNKLINYNFEYDI